ncbi:MAG: DUF3073 domain-containing protein [Streptosporangiaceae bacterium]|jgi:hypothetical protein
MGRGRAKAKQVKVARQLKYNSGGTDLDRLRAELGAETGHRTSSDTDHDGFDDDSDDDTEPDDDPDESWGRQPGRLEHAPVRSTARRAIIARRADRPGFLSARVRVRACHVRSRGPPPGTRHRNRRGIACPPGWW